MQAGGFMNTQASYDPNANSGGMGDMRYTGGGEMGFGGNMSRAGNMTRAGRMSHAVNKNGAGDIGNASSTAMSSGFGGGSGLVSEARRYVGSNPTGRGSLWCARFMNMVLEKTGHRGTGSDMANSFAHYGTRVSGPQVGAIAVMSRGGRGGHVGIITGIDAQGNPIMISGNNGNRVREAPISRGRIYAYVMPN
ncbi:TIGR02594 family protein [Bradyrhizobium sp. YR681]|nr:TIGR02594 family protein [Bradyrhizobium sp. YR681]